MTSKPMQQAKWAFLNLCKLSTNERRQSPSNAINEMMYTTIFTLQWHSPAMKYKKTLV